MGLRMTGDTSFPLAARALSPFGYPPAPDREGAAHDMQGERQAVGHMDLAGVL